MSIHRNGLVFRLLESPGVQGSHRSSVFSTPFVGVAFSADVTHDPITRAKSGHCSRISLKKERYFLIMMIVIAGEEESVRKAYIPVGTPRKSNVPSSNEARVQLRINFPSVLHIETVEKGG